MNTEKKICVLLIEDDDIDAENVQHRLRKNGNGSVFEVRHASTLADGIEQLRQCTVHAVLLDPGLPDGEGIGSLLKLQTACTSVPIVILTGLENVSLALDCIREGAQDYLVKEDADDDRFSHVIRFAIERHRGEVMRSELNAALAELDAARDIQQSLYPNELPDVAGFDIAGHWQPASNVGGDYFDYFEGANGYQIVLCADVCGHGLKAAILALQLRSIVRSVSTIGQNAAELVRCFNRQVSAEQSDHMFTTITLARINPQSGEIEFVGAGHDAYILKSDGTLRRTLKPQSPPLNVIEHDSQIQEECLTLEPGEVLVFYTDGVTEAGGVVPYGVERMLRYVGENRSNSSEQIVHGLLQDATRFSGTDAPQDDMTSVIVKRNSID